MNEELFRHLHEKGSFCHPDWDAIAAEIDEKVPSGGRSRIWKIVAHEWAERLRRQLGGEYQLTESDEFMLISEHSEKDQKEALRFFEEVSAAISEDLPEKNGEHYGRTLVMIFSQPDDYYEYISYFYREGEFPTSGGICLYRDGYMHIAILMEEGASYEAVFVHEMTHGFLCHRPVPLWLNEALALRMEEVLLGNSTVSLNPERFALHKELWNAETIQEFWSGASWQQPDLGSLSYDLALIVWHDLEVEQKAGPKLIKEFIDKARWDDAGQVACREVFGVELGALVTAFLGEGNWEPRPEVWGDAD